MVDENAPSRRSFLKTGAVAGAALVAGESAALADETSPSGALSGGDIAVLRFLAAAELIEADLWQQYAELGGTQDAELPNLKGGSPRYIAKLVNLDGDMPQYIHDNTQDEISHHRFINAYLRAKGAQPVSLDEFRTLPSSKATGAAQIGRLTNLTQLTVDTSWYTRYRSSRHNPDLDDGFVFPQAVKSLAAGRFPAIPRSDSDLYPDKHLQAIANTASFHFALIEQGGTSLYAALAEKVTSLEVLRILFSIGATEVAHFQTWHDKAGNAVQPPLAPLTDPTTPSLVFPNLNASGLGELFQTSLIMPEPCPFLDPHLPSVSIIRPTSDRKAGAVAAVKGLAASGLFIGQSRGFFSFVVDLAHDADRAQRGSVN